MVTAIRNVTAAASWMPCPTVDIEYPSLAYIYPLDELIVVKQTDAFHDIVGEKNSTGYTIFNNLGQKVFLAVEKQLYRRGHIKIFNFYGNEVIHVDKPFKLCKNKVLIFSPAGNFVGAIKWLPFRSDTFTVEDCSLVMLKIKAKSLCKTEYELTTYEGVVGKLANNWKDSAFLDVKNFGFSFPRSMNVLDKALLVGACFVIGCLKYKGCY